MGRLRAIATGFSRDKIPNDARVAMLEADLQLEQANDEIERLRLALAKCVNRSDLSREVERIALDALAPKEPKA